MKSSNGSNFMILTAFSTLASVSVYSVYNLVVNGVFILVSSIANGFYSFLGDMLAKNENNRLEKNFCFFEWFMHNFSVFNGPAKKSL